METVCTLEYKVYTCAQPRDQPGKSFIDKKYKKYPNPSGLFL